MGVSARLRFVTALAVTALFLTTSCGGGSSAALSAAVGASTPITFTTSDGVQLAGRLFGPADARAGVVLAHMLPADQTSWYPFAQRLAEQGYRVLTFDFRGYCPGGDGGCSQGTKQVDAAPTSTCRPPSIGCAPTGVERVGIAGASMGGTAALLVAGDDPRGIPAVVSAVGAAGRSKASRSAPRCSPGRGREALHRRARRSVAARSPPRTRWRAMSPQPSARGDRDRRRARHRPADVGTGRTRAGADRSVGSRSGLPRRPASTVAVGRSATTEGAGSSLDGPGNGVEGDGWLSWATVADQQQHEQNDQGDGGRAAHAAQDSYPRRERRLGPARASRSGANTARLGRPVRLRRSTSSDTTPVKSLAARSRRNASRSSTPSPGGQVRVPPLARVVGQVHVAQPVSEDAADLDQVVLATAACDVSSTRWGSPAS